MIQVIVPFFNCGPWIARTLFTLDLQVGARFDVFVIDDESTDGSSVIAEALCQEYGFTYHRNTENMKCPHSIREAVMLADPHPETIIFLLDGDDFLPHDGCLASVQAEYDNDPELWVAYGKYDSAPYDVGCRQAYGYSDQVIADRSYREAGPHFNHPLTFKTWLWNRIKDRELQTPNGGWLQLGYDRAIMYPLLEMATDYAGKTHWKCMQEIIYTYNSINPFSEFHYEPPHDPSFVDTYRKKCPQWQFSDAPFPYEESPNDDQ